MDANITMNQAQRACVLRGLRVYRDSKRGELDRLQCLLDVGRKEVKPQIEELRAEMHCIDSVVRLIWAQHR